MNWYQPLRRLPEAHSQRFLRAKILPLLPGLAESIALTVIAEIAAHLPLNWPQPKTFTDALQVLAAKRGDQVIERAQRIYFQNPGLDTLTVRAVAKLGWHLGWLSRTYLSTIVFFGLDKDGSAAKALTQLPRTGYESLMTWGLASGSALGYFQSGQVHHFLWWDSQRAEKNQPQPELPPQHPLPAVRRFQAPRTLTDLAADIEDMYWADAFGQPLKITRVGSGQARRWLISVPGTDHMQPQSTQNVADLESNIREALNLPSAMRVGMVQAIHAAMEADGIAPADRVRQKVLICGHSQGGMVAVALAAHSPEEVGFTVDAVITEGAPARRLRVRPDVALLSIEHDQDVVPSLDGTPRRQMDQRVVYRRSLVLPRLSALFYAHSASTYTETLRRFERQSRISLQGRSRQVAERLFAYLPQNGEECRVTHHYVWQEVQKPQNSQKTSAWGEYVNWNSQVEAKAGANTVQFAGEFTLPKAGVVQPLSERAEELRDDFTSSFSRIHDLLGGAHSKTQTSSVQRQQNGEGKS